MISPISFIATIRNSFIGASHVFTHGSCYHFFLILADVFGPEVKPYFFDNHVISKIGDKYYDIDGEVNGGQYKPCDFAKHDLHKKPFSLWDCGLECPSCDEIVTYAELLKEAP